MLLRLVEPLLFHERPSGLGVAPDLRHQFAVDERICIGRVQGQRPVDALQRLVRPAQIMQGDPHAGVPPHMTRVDLEQPPVDVQRFFGAVLSDPHQGEILEGNLVAGIHFQGVPQAVRGLVESGQVHECAARIGMRVDAVRLLCRGDTEGRKRFLRALRGNQRIAEIVLRAPRRRIVRENMRVERHVVPIDARLLPRQHPQHDQEHRRRSDHPPLRRGRQPV